MKALLLLVSALTAHAQFGTPGDLSFWPKTTDWMRRVIANGGPAPSGGTVAAVEKFRLGAVAQGLDAAMVTVLLFPPDSLIAALTPIFATQGNNPWWNSNFVSGDLTVNGLTGNGTSKYLLSGLLPNTINTAGFDTTNAGMSELLYASPTVGLTDLASGNSGGQQYFAVFNGAGPTASFRCWKYVNSGQDFVTGSVGSSTGWFSGNRTAANAIALYHARSTIPFTTVASASTTQSGTPTGQNLCGFAVVFDGAVSGYSDHTVSCLAVHRGLTSVQSSNLYVLVSTARIEFGGGNP